MRYRAPLLALTLVFAVALAGCWDNMEIDEVALVGSIGLDLGEEGNAIVSLEIINPAAVATGSGNSAGNPPPVVAIVSRDEAPTISAAIANAQRRVPRTIATGLINTVICGQPLARQGIGQYIDYLIRDAGIRRSAVLATCDTGAGLLQRPYMDPIASRTLSGLAQSAVEGGKTMTVTLNEFAVKLAEPGIEPITLHTVGRRTKDVQVKTQGEQVRQTEPALMLEQPINANTEIDGELPSDSPVFDPLKEGGSGEFMPGTTIDIGIAAYKGDKLVGLLDGVEARGYLWTTGKLEAGVVEIPDPRGSGNTVSFDVVRSSASVKPSFGEQIRIRAELHIDLEASQVPLGMDLRDKKLIEEFESHLDALVLREVQSTLTRVQKELRTDIYGFGNKVYRAKPKLWAELEPRWNEEIFPNLEVEFKIHTRVRGPGAVYGLDNR
jgi:spore germination protein KC